MRVPTLKFDTLWHIGDLDISRKYACGRSQEGSLFSMSRCPDAWRQIVKLGGYELYEGHGGFTLLDMLRITDPTTRSERQLKSSILKWAYGQGYLVASKVMQGRYFDDELEQMCQIPVIQAEIDEEPERFEEIIEIQVHAATQKLCLLHNLRADPNDDALDFAIIEWARAHCGKILDGVYWNQAYKPLAHQAPRAGIFDIKIDQLRKCDKFPKGEEMLIKVRASQWLDVGQVVDLEP